MVKVIGIGNILLSDDGIGVKVVEKIKDDILRLDENIEVIIGENDYLYCLEEINDNDFVIIVDSSYFNEEVGNITVLSLKECDKFINNIELQHEINLVKSLRQERSTIKGYLIGIEICNIDYSLELSDLLKNKFNDICKDVLLIIGKLINEIY